MGPDMLSSGTFLPAISHKAALAGDYQIKAWYRITNVSHYSGLGQAPRQWQTEYRPALGQALVQSGSGSVYSPPSDWPGSCPVS